MTPDTTDCSICLAPIEDPHQRGQCDECLQPFHLNLRTDIVAPGCGAAYISGACGMNVFCNRCSDRFEMAAAGVHLVRVGGRE